MRSVAAAALVFCFALGCAHEVTPEERLDKSTEGMSGRSKYSASNLDKMRCNDAQGQLAAARAENQSETERLNAYANLYDKLKHSVSAYDDALAHNTDLAYSNGGTDLTSARDLCNQALGEVRGDFERYTRELITNPTTQEIRGGATITVPRVDFDPLRRAVTLLAPDDRQELQERINAAASKYGNVASARGGKKR